MKTKFFFYSLFLVITLSKCENRSSDIINNPTVLMEKYFASETWQERLKYVLDSARIKPQMESYYDKYDFSKRPNVNDIKQMQKNPALDLPDSVIIMRISATGQNAYGYKITDQLYYYIVETKDGLKIDYPSSVGSNLLSLNVYKATMPADIKTFRLTCKLSDT
jgi:hypothetical protein